jgi:hypothetical protein
VGQAAHVDVVRRVRGGRMHDGRVWLRRGGWRSHERSDGCQGADGVGGWWLHRERGRGRGRGGWRGAGGEGRGVRVSRGRGASGHRRDLHRQSLPPHPPRVVRHGDMEGGDERRRGDSEGSVKGGEEGDVHDRGRGGGWVGGLWVIRDSSRCIGERMERYAATLPRPKAYRPCGHR